MTVRQRSRRLLGTMVAYGFAGGNLSVDLAIARRIGAEVVELLPDWRALPDPKLAKVQVADAGLVVHSAHGCWGGQSIHAPRVDLASTDLATHLASLNDLKLCVDWLTAAGGSFLVIHPGGLSDPDETDQRGEALMRGLALLADHTSGTGVTLCVENMPPGVHPGSRMSEIVQIVCTVNRAEVAVALDTGHAHITSSAEHETLSASHWLKTTHVHDNDGRQDVHWPPGLGTIDWSAWKRALDEVGYEGPVMLECIRHLRNHPETITPELLRRLGELLQIGSLSSEKE